MKPRAPLPGFDKRARRGLLQRVRRGDVKHAQKLSHSRTLIVLDHAGKELRLVYSGVRKQIISVLPSADMPEDKLGDAP